VTSSKLILSFLKVKVSARDSLPRGATIKPGQRLGAQGPEDLSSEASLERRLDWERSGTPRADRR
jgi:hypothetical protein